MRSTHWFLATVLSGALLLASCTTSPPVSPVPTPEASTGKAAWPGDLQGAKLYQIDPAASSVHILVYRGGTMAKMGHNHVISSKTIAGYAWYHNAWEHSGFDIVVPVNELIIDDDTARAMEGAEFPLNVNDAAKQGTRDNMLSAALLDGAQFPFISIKSIGMSGAKDAPQMAVAIRIRDQTRELTVPVALAAGDGTLRAHGMFEISQTEFGITPFSVAMGALQVVDVVKVKFDLLALQIQPQDATD